MGQGTPGEDTGMWMWMGQETSPRVKTNPQKSSVWELAHGEMALCHHTPNSSVLSSQELLKFMEWVSLGQAKGGFGDGRH